MMTEVARSNVRTSGTQEPWRRLAGWTGIGTVALLVSAAAGFRDLEAAAIAVGVIVALALLRLRSGLLGEIALGLLFANIAAWMTPGAVSNLRHHENWVASALPASLAIASLAGLVAAVALLAGRRVNVASTRTPRAIAVAAVALIAIANISAAIGETGGSIAQPGDIVLTAQHVKFDETEPEAQAGRIGVVLGNLDLFWHTFTITELGVNLNVPVQAERRVEFDAPRGTYRFVCKIPGHIQAGMEGTLTVR